MTYRSLEGTVRTRAIALLIGGLVLAAATIAPAPASAQGAPPAGSVETTPIGKLISLKGTVTVEHTQAVVLTAALAPIGQAKAGDFVYRGDVVQTGADSAAGITFADGTAFNIASNARMVLNEFVYDPKSKSNSTLISLTKGTFTFVAGQVAKTGDMKIETPVATMGIRGTTPHVEIKDDGTVSFATLLEDGKPRAAQPPGIEQKRGAAPKQQREAKAPGPPSAAQQAIDRELDKQKNFKLNICRGC